jgi:hypothetical protein
LKKIYPFVLTLFFILLLSVPLYWLFKGEAAPEESTVEARTLVALQPKSTPNLQRALDHLQNGEIFEAADILINLFTSASFVEKIEQATSDQFPIRMPIIHFSKALERGIVKFAYSFVGDKVIPADMTTGIYIDTENNQLIFTPNTFNKTTRAAIDQRIQNYEALIQAHPEQNFYIYYFQTLHHSDHHPINQFFSEADRGQSIAYFEENKPEGLTLGKFLLTSMDDHLYYYYRTDHHWNIYGMLQAYEEIHAMLSRNYPDISPILEPEDIVVFPDVKFLGYLARRTFYPIEGDEFAVEVVDFPPLEMVKSGVTLDRMPRWDYFEGNYSLIPYTNHYKFFYGEVTDLIEFRSENESNRNLLIFGSSFTNSLDPLLASHYKNTYSVDLRYFTSFSLSEFLAEHDVDDIIVIGDNGEALDDIEYWLINP